MSQLLYWDEVPEPAVLVDDGFINIYGNGYHLSEFIPNVKGVALVAIFKEIYNCIISIEDKSVTITPIKDILNSDVEDISEFADPKFQGKLNDGTNYTFLFNVDAEENFYTLFPEQFTQVIGPNTEADKIIDHGFAFGRPLATGPAVVSPLSDDLADLLAYGESPFIYTEGGENETYDKLLLGLWRGAYTNNGDKWPLAINTNIVHDVGFGGAENKISDAILQWGETGGLVDKWWTEFLELQQSNKDVSKLFYLPIHKIKELASFKKPMKRFYHQKGNVTGVLTQFSVTLSNSGISPTKTTFKIKN